MDKETIKKLLERYMDGETSIVEERQLKAYFAEQEVPEEWEHFRAYFGWINAEKTRKMPVSKQKTGKTVPLRTLLSIAAALALLICAVVFFNNYSEIEQAKIAEAQHQTDTFDDPEQARKEIEAALALVSRKMRKGETKANKGLQKTKNVNKLFKPLQ